MEDHHTFQSEDANVDQLMARVYRTVLLKSKRSRKSHFLSKKNHKHQDQTSVVTIYFAVIYVFFSDCEKL